jgi:pyruvate kinase
VAQYRPSIPILAVTTEPTTYRRLALTWGVAPALIDPVTNTDAMLQATIDAGQRLKFVKPGHLVVLTAGVPVNNPGTTNLIKVHCVGQPLIVP